jgi:hypothetical protein
MGARKKASVKKVVKRVAPKKGAAKKKVAKAKDLSQAHGKVEKGLPSTLDQIWGDTGMHKYKTLEETEYSEQLKDMARVDLQAHAVKVGLIPIDNAEQLKKRLLLEFRKYTAAYKVPRQSQKSQAPISREGMKILEEGK